MIKVAGRYVIEKNGKIIRKGKNLVTTVGLAAIANLLHTGTVQPRYMAIGDSDAGLSAAHTALQGSELDRVATTESAAGVEFTAVGTFTAGSSITVKEVGIFSASSAGTMFARFLPTNFSLATGESVTITWILEFS